MDTPFIYELIGYLASALVTVSLMMSKIVRLRIINMLGAFIFIVYGLLINSIPVAGVNAFIVLVNFFLPAAQPRINNTETEDQEPPNIVFIISDDQSWTGYSFMGQTHVQTPHIDNLASEGLTFTRGYLPAPICRLTLASMLTGHYRAV